MAKCVVGENCPYFSQSETNMLLCGHIGCCMVIKGGNNPHGQWINIRTTESVSPRDHSVTVNV